MAWKEVHVEDQRKLFIKQFELGKYSIAELCRQFEISRPTAYKWINRYEELGFEGLLSQSRAPTTQANATPNEVIDEIISLRGKYFTWGPKKIKAFLERHYPSIDWPSTTTIGNILTKHGLVTPRKLRRRLAAKVNSLSDCEKSNDLWCLDFKGWHITKDGHKFDPFTLTDTHSRYLLACVKLPLNNADNVWGVLERCFRDFGLPLYLRSDNGPPFATSSPGRLSRLSVKLIKAGVMPEWIEPGNPQQNGQHERMHGVLEKEGMLSSLCLKEQQIKLNEFVDYYNNIRPHEALGQKLPSDIYTRSTRVWNGRLISPEYPSDYKVGRVKSCGKMCYNGKEIYIGRVLSDEPVGIKQNELGLFEVYYGSVFLGIIKENNLQIERRKGRIRQRSFN
jgi:putative transposase